MALYDLPTVAPVDFVGRLQQGFQAGAQMAQQPIINQLNQLKMKEAEQRISANEQSSLDARAAKDTKRRQEFTDDLNQYAMYRKTLPMEQLAQADAAFRLTAERENNIDLLNEIPDFESAVGGMGYGAAPKTRFAPKSTIGTDLFKDSVSGELYRMRDTFDPNTNTYNQIPIPVNPGAGAPQGDLSLMSKKGLTAKQEATAAGLVAKGKKAGEIQAKLDTAENVAEMEGWKKFQEKAAIDKQGYRNALQVEARGLGSQIRNIDRAIAAIDEGARSGVVISKMPTFTKATAELESAAKSLGIDVINSATFGALSEKELQLALDTAVPMNLAPNDLKQWLSDKRDATEKLRGEMIRLSRFLAKRGNTLDMWEETQQQGKNLNVETLDEIPQGWSLMVDGKGNLAYVSPDRTQFKKVK